MRRVNKNVLAGSTCEACGAEAQLIDDPAKLGQKCRSIFARADARASSFVGIRSDMKASQVPLKGLWPSQMNQ